MSIQLPTAPLNFYSPSLTELKSVLEAQNGSTFGQIALINAAPLDIENAWAVVGAGNDITDVGTNVIGLAPLSTISEISIGDIEGGTNESAYKLTFSGISDIPILIDGSGSTTDTVVGSALIVGRDSLAIGTNADVRYIMAVKDLLVTDGGLVSIPEFEIAINYSEVG